MLAGKNNELGIQNDNDQNRPESPQQTGCWTCLACKLVGKFDTNLFASGRTRSYYNAGERKDININADKEESIFAVDALNRKLRQMLRSSETCSESDPCNIKDVLGTSSGSSSNGESLSPTPYFGTADKNADIETQEYSFDDVFSPVSLTPCKLTSPAPSIFVEFIDDGKIKIENEKMKSVEGSALADNTNVYANWNQVESKTEMILVDDKTKAELTENTDNETLPKDEEEDVVEQRYSDGYLSDITEENNDDVDKQDNNDNEENAIDDGLQTEQENVVVKIKNENVFVVDSTIYIDEFGLPLLKNPLKEDEGNVEHSQFVSRCNEEASVTLVEHVLQNVITEQRKGHYLPCVNAEIKARESEDSLQHYSSTSSELDSLCSKEHYEINRNCDKEISIDINTKYLVEHDPYTCEEILVANCNENDEFSDESDSDSIINAYNTKTIIEVISQTSFVEDTNKANESENKKMLTIMEATRPIDKVQDKPDPENTNDHEFENKTDERDDVIHKMSFTNKNSQKFLTTEKVAEESPKELMECSLMCDEEELYIDYYSCKLITNDLMNEHQSPLHKPDSSTITDRKETSITHRVSSEQINKVETVCNNGNFVDVRVDDFGLPLLDSPLLKAHNRKKHADVNCLLKNDLTKDYNVQASHDVLDIQDYINSQLELLEDTMLEVKKDKKPVGDNNSEDKSLDKKSDDSYLQTLTDDTNSINAPEHIGIKTLENQGNKNLENKYVKQSSQKEQKECPRINDIPNAENMSIIILKSQENYDMKTVLAEFADISTGDIQSQESVTLKIDTNQEECADLSALRTRLLKLMTFEDEITEAFDEKEADVTQTENNKNPEKFYEENSFLMKTTNSLVDTNNVDKYHGAVSVEIATDFDFCIPESSVLSALKGRRNLAQDKLETDSGYVPSSTENSPDGVDMEKGRMADDNFQENRSDIIFYKTR